jgi:hypothetical protein
VTTADRAKHDRSRRPALLGYALVAVSVWLGWEALKAPVVERAHPAMALRLAPGSPEALRRAAEGELLAEEWEDAAFLADRSLASAPFNARALRVRGLSAARTGNVDQADQLLTLAGNWSLRDDPAHAWLVEHRLRQGSYSSAFGHADTLARRRRDLHEQVFNLFMTAAIEDPRAVPSLVRLIAANPPWRASFLQALQRREDGDALLLNLAVALGPTSAPLTDPELSRIYQGWVRERRYAAIAGLRRALGRPALGTEVQNGDFSQAVEEQLPPLGWSFGAAAGLSVQIMEDDLRPSNRALRIDYDGYRTTVAASQLLLLAPGRHDFSVRYRLENLSPASFEWILTCVEGGAPLMRLRLPDDQATGDWKIMRATVDVSESCTAQTLTLAPRAADRRSPFAVWFDDVEVRPAGSASHQG